MKTVGREIKFPIPSCRQVLVFVVLTVFLCSVLIYNHGTSDDIFTKIIERHSFQIQMPDIKTVLTKLESDDYLQSKREQLTLIPLNIFMLWDRGWSKAPQLQQKCLESLRRMNPEFNMIPMNLSLAEMLIDRKLYYKDDAWKSASIQAKSDIIRVELLANYGGIWADASVYCNEPLMHWLNDDLLPVQFLVYERRDKKVKLANSPWISSWFIVSTKDSFIIQTWRDEIRKAWSQTPIPSKQSYLWVHRIFRQLVHNNTQFGEHFKTMPFLDADGPHCFDKNITPHVYKIKANSCKEERERLIFEV